MTDVDAYLNELEAALKARESAPPGKAVSAVRMPAVEPSLLAEAFAALLALEEGEPGARPVRLVIGSAEPRLSEGFLDELARRVAERLKNV